MKFNSCYLIFLGLALWTTSCVPESKKIDNKVNLDFMSPSFRHVVNLEQAGEIDSLLELMVSDNVTHRYLATRAIASLQDPSTLDTLYGLLDDPVLNVRAMAAYAIGQIGSPKSESELIRAFRQKDTMSVNNKANAEILIALGKLASETIAKYISTADGYRTTDSILIEGQMKSLYQFGLRDIVRPEMIVKAMETIKDKTIYDNARLYAAHFLARTNNLDISDIQFQIAESLTTETNVEIKIALASALRHTDHPEIFTIIKDQLSIEQDYRVKCNLIKTLGSYNDPQLLSTIREMTADNNLNIARTAAEYIRRYGDPKDAYTYRNMITDSMPAYLRADMYEAVYSIIPHYYGKTKNATRWRVQRELAKDSTPYVQSKLLHALGHDPENFRYIKEYLKDATDIRVKTAGIEAIGSLTGHKDFYNVYTSLSRSMKREIFSFLTETMDTTRDEGIIASVADIISNPNAGLSELIDSTDFLIAAKQKLSSPGQIESIHAIDRALSFLRGLSSPNLSTWDKKQTVDWESFSEFKPSTKAIIKTNRGIFAIKLKASEAPGSVSNFVRLAEEDYYDDMPFHRIVPNFVAQTGSPRGDNYGGKNYVIHSELSASSYDQSGYVGMASAGLHTESTQWFVTHSAAPHLDGKYTIFGEVIEGMDVVHTLSIGDKIQDVIISHL